VISPEDNLGFEQKINQQLRINAACEQFENEWKVGNQPEIIKYLDDSDKSDRSELLHELLSIDSHWRWINNSKLSREDYAARLPNDGNVVQEYFNQLGSSLDQFLYRMSDSGLLSQKKLQSILKKLPIANRPANPQELIELLVQQEKLTAYQAQQLSQGTINKLILGDYLIQDVIGAGGMGQVYLAEHRRMERRVALKMLPESVAQDSQSVLRFQREVRAAAKLSHPNIVTAYDAGEANDVHYFVMEWVKGTDLSKLVKQKGKLPVAQVLNYILQAARALEYAHREGVTHRDIKPANLILDNKGIIKILDMGLAYIDSPDDENTRTGLTLTGMVMGTVDYMSPEQALDSRNADARSDIYSLGCMLHYLLTGKVIFNGDTVLKKIFAHRESSAPSLSAVDAEIPFALDAVFQKMVAKEPGDRQQSMTQVIAELEACVNFNTPTAPFLATEKSSDSTDDDLLIKRQTGKAPSIDYITPHHAAAKDEKHTQYTRLLDGTPLSTNHPPQFKKQIKLSRRKIIPGVIICLLALIGLAWNTGVFSPVDQPPGTLIVEVDQLGLTGAIVSVDGQEKFKLKRGNSPEPIQIESVNQIHTLMVLKDGFKDFKKEFSVQPGESQKINVRLEPLKAGMNELLTSSGKSPQGKQSAVTDPHKQLVENGVQNGMTIGYWTPTGISGFHKNSDEVPIPLERVAVNLIGIYSKYLKSDFEWESIGRVNTIFRITCDTPMPIATLKRLKGVTILQLYGCQLTEKDVSLISGFQNLRAFILYGNVGVTDVSCNDIAKISSLRELDINATGITGEGLKILSVLPNLYSLSLGLSNGITVEDLANLRTFRSLRSLTIQSTKTNENLVEQLGSLNSLKMINLQNIKMSEADLIRLQKLLPECSVIHPSAPPSAADQQVAEWVIENQGSFNLHGSTHQKHQRLPQQPSFAMESIEITGLDGLTIKSSQLDRLRSLEKLILMRMTSTDIGLVTVGKLSTLRYLAISYSDVSALGLEQIKELNQLESLHFKRCRNLSDDALQHIRGFSQLTSLGLSQTALTDLGLKHVSKTLELQDLYLASCPNISSAGLEYLTALSKLRNMDLNSTPITDAAIPHLQKMKSLRVLRIYDTKITAEGAKQLQAGLPECVVFHESLKNVPWAGTSGFMNNPSEN